jgi:hypothetical protein
MFPFVSHGCETWSVTLNEERSLRVFENGVLGEVFGPKGVEMLNDELHGVCCSLSIIRVVGWAVHVARMGEKRGAYRVFMGRPDCKWNHNIETILDKWDWRTLIGLIWLRIGTVGGLL